MPARSPEKAPEHREVPTKSPLDAELDSLRVNLGDPGASISEKMSQQDIQRRREEIMNDYTISNYQELNELNALSCAKSRLERAKQFRGLEKAGTEPSYEQEQETVVMNQALTYHQYFPEVISHVYNIMTKYEARRNTLPAQVTKRLAKGEKQAQLYIASLNDALTERVAFSNAMLAAGLIRVGRNPSGEHLDDADKKHIQDLLQTHLANPKLSEASRRVLSKGDDRQNRIRGNELNQKIIDVLSGEAKIAGVPKGFLPQQLYLDLLSREYEHLLEIQIGIARDPTGIKALSQMKRMQIDHARIKALGDKATREEIDKMNADLPIYEGLQNKVRDRNSKFAKLHAERKEVTDELVTHTNALGGYQIQSSKLSTLQLQFGAMDDPDALDPKPSRTPEKVRAAIGKNMETRSNFHFTRLDSFANVLDEEVLRVGFPEQIEHASIKTLRPLFLKIASGVAAVMTLPVPKTAGLKARVRKSIVGDLAESMGWPLNPDGSLKEELTPEEEKKVKEKMTSIKDAINSFDRSKIERFQGTIGVLRSMPKASTFVNDEVKEVPQERITTQNMEEMIKIHGGPAVYLRLFEQLQGDWGELQEQPATGLIGEIEVFLKKIDKNISTHLNVGKALHELSQKSFDYIKLLLASILGLIVVYKGGKFLVRRKLRGMKAARVAKSRKEVKRLRSENAALQRRLRKAGGANAATETAEAANERKLKELVGTFGKKMPLEKVQEFLETAQKSGAIKLDPDTIALIGESRGAKKIIAGAAETGDITEINRALKAARRARSFRIAGNAVGAVGDVFAVYMAYADFMANGERIETAKETGNKALAEMYNDANYLYAAEGAEGVAGLTIGGIAIVKAYAGGQSVLTALGASGGLVMLPVAAAVLSGGYVYRKAEAASETWMREYKDWIRALPPGMMLEKLKEVGPGKRAEGQGYAKGTIAEQIARKAFTSRKSYQKWSERGEDTIESANSNVRREISKAYVVRSSLLPRNRNESDKDYQKRFDQYVIDQMQYLGMSSQGTYAYQMGEGYEWGREYANLMAKSRELKKMGKSEQLQWRNKEEKKMYSFDLRDFASLPWEDKDGRLGRRSILHRYIMVKKQSIAPQFNIMVQIQGMKEVQRRQAIKQHLILRNHDSFYRLNGRIGSADFEGWGITGGEPTGEALACYTASKLIQEELERQTNSLLKKSRNGGMTQNDVRSAITSIGAILDTQDPLKFQKIGKKRNYESRHAVQNPERSAGMLNSLYFLREMQNER